MNYAENLLKYKNDDVAIEFFCENKINGKITYKQLNREVKKIFFYLKELGVNKGDVVAGFMPNIPETIIAMLACASIGAIWTSCSPDFGINGVLDRFSQSKPKVLFVSDGYFYKGKKVNLFEKINQIQNGLSSVEEIIYVSIINSNDLKAYKSWNSINDNSNEIQFASLPFSHPLYIMYSSGTTGKPKSIVHSAGGTLIQHLKELLIHCDLKKNDKIFYFTTCGWMMWNWLVSSLFSGATIVLYDGNPFYPKEDSLLKIANDINISIFGTSAKYISYLEQINVQPNKYDFKNLKSILSTGSPLVEENYDYVYTKWKNKVQLCSISGGTDIISCFALGNPIKPIKKGYIQSIGLGMNVKSFNKNGVHQIDTKGELVCISPFPSMPIKFLNDNNNNLYHKAYFDTFENVWRHGDFISISNDNMVKIFGRSDTTLNPGGVRIGTAEIYRVIDKIEEVDDSVVVGYKLNNDELIILFVKLHIEKLTNDLVNYIKNQIKINCSPRHVPFKVFHVTDIPYTINGKKVEIAVKNTLENIKINNKDALSNPECLREYKNIKII
tara:strand:+ start:7 stop:1671 length:1665 start_codon:yes stop_codon:yes gene_type:complete